jgi:hypothetical protein
MTHVASSGRKFIEQCEVGRTRITKRNVNQQDIRSETSHNCIAPKVDELIEEKRKGTHDDKQYEL